MKIWQIKLLLGLQNTKKKKKKTQNGDKDVVRLD